MSIKSPFNNKNAAQNRRVARFQIDLSFPMIFCIAEAILLIGLLAAITLFFKDFASKEAMEALRFAWENDKYVAAICAGPTVLADLGITDGKKAVCYPGFEQELHKACVTEAAVIRDGNLITAASAGCAVKFALELIRALKGDAAADAVAQQIVIR